jgi:hypothetical protein
MNAQREVAKESDKEGATSVSFATADCLGMFVTLTLSSNFSINANCWSADDSRLSANIAN